MNMYEYYFSMILAYMILWGCCIGFLLSMKQKTDWKLRVTVSTGIWAVWIVLSYCMWFMTTFESLVWIISAGMMCVILLGNSCQETKSVVLYCSIWSLLLTQILVQGWSLVWGLTGKCLSWWLLVVWGSLWVFILKRTLICWLQGSEGYYVGPRKLILSVITCCIFELCVVFLQRDDFDLSMNMENIVLIIIQIYCITVLYMQHTLFQKSAMRQELDTMNLLWKQQKVHYELSRENIALINQKCHDLKHQISAIRAMGSSEERSNYIKELQDSLNIYDSVVRTGNEVLDTILTEKSLYCEAHGIKIHCIADGKQMDFVDPVDLYTIMGNALDNAIESVEKIQEKDKRIIDVLVFVKEKFLVINVTNPISHKVLFENGIPVTTKEKNGYHGFGTKSIKHTAQKYGGHTSFQIEKDCFVLRILFPIL